MSPKKYDAVVIGAGSGGLTAAVGLSKIGKKVLLIEKEHIGGECTNSGCIPSKALLHHAKAYYKANQIAGSTAQSETYRQAAFTYVRKTIASILAHETKEHFTKQGIDVVLGEAVFDSQSSITVADTTYSFKKAIIATGSKPRTINIPGLEQDKILTNQNLFSQINLPKQILIIGGGPIGLEMGQALAYLGSKVTLINNGPRLAALEDEAISPIIEQVFNEIGVTIINNASVKSVAGNVASITANDGTFSKEFEVTFDQVLIAIGRIPNIPNGTKEAGVNTTDFGITVNNNFQTSNKNIYALGDVSAALKFTHVADDSARQAIMHIASFGLIKPKVKAVPKVTFTNPEIAQVGQSWKNALLEYGETNIHRIEVPFSENDRSRTDGATTGLLIIVAKRVSGKIIGTNIIGPHAGELLGVLTLAMENNISLYKIRSTIFAYPTYSLILKKAGDYFLATQIKTLKADLIAASKILLPKIIIASLWLFGLYTLFSYKQAYGLTVNELTIQVFSQITTSAFAPLLYILIYAIRPITFFPGTALTILSGVFFGLYGILYTIIGANLSAALAYFVGRFFSKKQSSKDGVLGNWVSPLQKNPFLAILTMRLIFMPFDLVNYGAGLLRIPFVPYIIATIVGTILGIATFVSIGASLSLEEFIKNGITVEAIDTKFIILSAVIFIASIVIAKVLKRN